MAAYIALLRGINVGNNTLKMERLRKLCEELGLKNVKTYVQSGNVVFEAGKSSEHWLSTLERKLSGETRLPVSVIVRTAREMTKLIKNNPFLKEKGIDQERLYVTLLQSAPTISALLSLAMFERGSDKLKCVGRDIYLYCPGGYGRTKLSNATLERKLSVKATTRNWNTILQLSALAASLREKPDARLRKKPAASRR